MSGIYKTHAEKPAATKREDQRSEASFDPLASKVINRLLIINGMVIPELIKVSFKTSRSFTRAGAKMRRTMNPGATVARKDPMPTAT